MRCRAKTRARSENAPPRSPMGLEPNAGGPGATDYFFRRMRHAIIAATTPAPIRAKVSGSGTVGGIRASAGVQMDATTNAVSNRSISDIRKSSRGWAARVLRTTPTRVRPRSIARSGKFSNVRALLPLVRRLKHLRVTNAALLPTLSKVPTL